MKLTLAVLCVVAGTVYGWSLQDQRTVNSQKHIAAWTCSNLNEKSSGETTFIGKFVTPAQCYDKCHKYFNCMHAPWLNVKGWGVACFACGEPNSVWFYIMDPLGRVVTSPAGRVGSRLILDDNYKIADQLWAWDHKTIDGGLVNKRNQQYMAITGNQHAKGAAVITYWKHSTPNFLWKYDGRHFTTKVNGNALQSKCYWKGCAIEMSNVRNVREQHWYLIPYGKENCYKRGQGYAGKDIKHIKSVRTSWECQKECEKTAGCAKWTLNQAYHLNWGGCWLQAASAWMTKSYWFISGPKKC